MKLFRIVGVVIVGAIVAPLIFMQAQEPLPKQMMPVDKAKGLLKDIRGDLRDDKPAKDVLASLAALREINEQLQHRSTYNQIVFLLAHRDPAVRREAAKAMAEISRTSDDATTTVQHLMKIMDHRDVETRVTVLSALCLLIPQSKPAIPQALKALKDSDPRVRRTAVMFIGTFASNEKDLIPFVITALDDPDVGFSEKDPGTGSVGMVAMMRLERCKSEANGAVPKLVEIVEKKKFNDFFQGVAMRTLIAIDPKHPLPMKTAKECLKRMDNITELNRGAITLNFLGPHGKAAIPDLIAVLRMPPLADVEQERQLKSNVLSAFGAMGPEAKEVLPLLRSMLPTQDSNLRAYINQAIENIGRTK